MSEATEIELRYDKYEAREGGSSFLHYTGESYIDAYKNDTDCYDSCQLSQRVAELWLAVATILQQSAALVGRPVVTREIGREWRMKFAFLKTLWLLFSKFYLVTWSCLTSGSFVPSRNKRLTPRLKWFSTIFMENKASQIWGQKVHFW